MSIETLPPLREIIAQHDLVARKSHGQNFLFDLNILKKIVRFSGAETTDTIIEIGPGPGGLTRALFLEGYSNVIVIEKDPQFLNALQDIRAAAPSLQIVMGDALAVDFSSLGIAPRHIVANLPYNISTPILTNLLHHGSDIASITVLLQKEVTERIAAPHGSKVYGRLSILAQALCDVSLGPVIPGQAFVPPPKVTSQVIRLIPKPTTVCPKTLERVTAAAFQARRKMIKSTLMKILPLTEQDLQPLNIAPTDRPEQISIAGYVALAHLLQPRLHFGNVSLS
jgi:16S rRNA (adenine1518-N6/adenine1519-N6)-dimethyltransferase